MKKQQYIDKCKCGNNKFIIITEKMYEGYINDEGVLVCLPEEQHIEEIECSICGQKYNVNDFKEVDY